MAIVERGGPWLQSDICDPLGNDSHSLKIQRHALRYHPGSQPDFESGRWMQDIAGVWRHVPGEWAPRGQRPLGSALSSQTTARRVAGGQSSVPEQFDGRMNSQSNQPHNTEYPDCPDCPEHHHLSAQLASPHQHRFESCRWMQDVAGVWRHVPGE